MKYIDVKNIYFSYYNNNEYVLKNVSYYLNSGEIVFLVGENGSAKTTLIKTTLKILKIDSGNIKISKYNKKGNKLIIGYLPQNVSLFNINFPSTVLKFIQSGYFLKKKIKLFNYLNNLYIKRILKIFEINKIKNKRISNLSIGEKQKINLARIFILNPDLFILDEPTIGLDEKSIYKFYNILLYNVKKNKKSVLIVTHDNNYISKYADRKIFL